MGVTFFDNVVSACLVIVATALSRMEVGRGRVGCCPRAERPNHRASQRDFHAPIRTLASVTFCITFVASV